jgi:hypothetical protein
MSATDKMTKIIETIKSGRTLVFSTHLKHVQVSPKTLAKWEASGHNLFKVSGNSVFMARGKNYDCIDGCKITIH